MNGMFNFISLERKILSFFFQNLPIANFLSFKKFDIWKNVKKLFWPIQFVQLFSFNEEIGHIEKLHFWTFYVLHKKSRQLRAPINNFEQNFVRILRSFLLRKLFADCATVWYQIKSQCQTPHFLLKSPFVISKSSIKYQM